MPDTPSITLIKKTNFRGKDEEWSNTYHFNGSTPGSDAAWKTLADALIAAERKVYSPLHQVVRVYGYEAGNEHAVGIIDYAAAPLSPIAGSFAVSSSFPEQAGDPAFWLRGRTPNRNSRGKWIYCRKMYHGVRADEYGRVDPNQRAAALALGTKLTDGSLPGGFKWCAPQGANAGAIDVSTYATTRTLKRRGKRPSR